MKTLFKAGYSTSSVIGLMDEFQQLADVQPRLLLNCSLNYKYNIIPEVAPTIDPQLGWFGMGTNGYYNVNTDNPPLSQPYIPKATDMDLYNPLPFRTVPVDNDLTPEERLNYRLRTLETFNGNKYFCYWLKKITILDNEVKVMRVDPSGKEEPYIFDNGNLHPVPSKSNTGSIIDADGDTLVVYLKGQCVITGAEVIESTNIIHNGDLRYANISEFSFVTSGQDVQTTGPDGAGGVITYTESAYCAMSAKRCMLPINFNSSEASHSETITFINSNIINI